MKQSINTDNKSALEFNQEISKLLQQLCTPLFPYGVKYFTYSRTFKDGKKLYISNNHEWVKLYVKNSFQDDIDHLDHYLPPPDIKRALWTGFKRDKVFDAAYNYNCWNGFSLYEHHKNYVDLFDFFSDREPQNIENFYINNIFFLECFINEFKKFKKKISKITDLTDESKFIFPKKYPLVNIHESFPSPNEDKIKKFYKDVNLLSNKHIFLDKN